MKYTEHGTKIIFLPYYNQVGQMDSTFSIYRVLSFADNIQNVLILPNEISAQHASHIN